MNFFFPLSLSLARSLPSDRSCSGLFEKDKLVFSFLLCVEIMRLAGTIMPEEWLLFTRGFPSVEKVSHYSYTTTQYS